MPTKPDNATLAKKVLGWKRCDCGDCEGWRIPTDQTHGPTLPDFANDIAAVRDLLLATGLRYSIAGDGDDVECCLQDKGVIGWTGIGKTIEAAVRAAVWAWLQSKDTTDG